MYDINKIHQVAVGKNLANGNSQDVETTTLVNKDSLSPFTKIVSVVGSKPLGKLPDGNIAQNNYIVNIYSMQTEETICII